MSAHGSDAVSLWTQGIPALVQEAPSQQPWCPNGSQKGSKATMGGRHSGRQAVRDIVPPALGVNVPNASQRGFGVVPGISFLHFNS